MDSPCWILWCGSSQTVFERRFKGSEIRRSTSRAKVEYTKVSIFLAPILNWNAVLVNISSTKVVV